MPPPQAKPPLWRRLLRRVENTLFGIVLVVVFLYFILQLPLVQNWLIGKVTAYLSKELQTKVTIQHLGFSFFDNIVLEGFYLEDLKGDTLLYTGRLSANLNTNIFSLLDNKLEINELSLQKARFNLRRGEGERYDNLRFLLDWLPKSKKDPNKPPSAFSLKAQHIYLTDVVFLQDDRVRGERMVFEIPAGAIRLDEFDALNKRLTIRNAHFDGLRFDYERYPSKPLPELISQKTKPTSSPADTAAAKPLQCFVERFSLSNSSFAFDKFTTPEAAYHEVGSEVMDYDHLDVKNIDFQADSVYFDNNLSFVGKLSHFSAQEQCGFVLQHAAAKQIILNDTLTALNGVQIQTPNSLLGDTIAFHYNTYRDYRQFVDKVKLDLRLANGSKLRLGDIMYFSGPVNRNKFFLTNRETVADVSGTINGKINRLNGRNLNIRVGQNAMLQGDFDGEDMAESRDLLRLEFDFKRLQSDFETIKKIIPGFNAPPTFARLGRIGFKGKYQIIFGYNHILDGQLITDVGDGDINMSLDLTQGTEKAIYSGRLDMRQFDMATWMGNQQFGRASFRAKIDEGSGLTLSSIKARMSGTIDTLRYKGYTYRSIGMDGAFKEKIFDGKIAARDPNFEFDFDGKIDLRDTFPVMDFKADITRLDLGVLNLVEEDWVLSGQVQQLTLNAHNWSDLTGKAVLRNFQILQDREAVHKIDSLILSSNYRRDGTRYISLYSDIADGYLEGDYDLARSMRRLLSTFGRYYPRFSQKIGLPKADSLPSTDDYNLRLQVKNTKQLTKLFSSDLDTLRDIYVKARVEGAQGLLQVLVEVPQLRYGNVAFRDASMSWYSLRDSATYNLRLPETQLSRKERLAPITLGGFLTDEALTFRLESKDDAAIVKSINLNGAFSIVDSLWQLKFNASEIALFNQAWYLDEDNYIRFGKNYFATRNFYMGNDYNQRILLDSLNGGHGLSLALTNFNLEVFNKFLGNTNLNIRGKTYDFDVKIEDLFAMKGINGFVNSDTVFIKNTKTGVEKPYGELIGNLELASLNAPLGAKLFLNGAGEQRLRLSMAWLLSGDSIWTDPEFGLLKPNYLGAQLDATAYPLDFIELIVPGISKTAGTFDADLALTGPAKRPDIDGKIHIRQGQTQLDYLKNTYYIKKQTVRLTERQIWADRDTITDGLGNRAVIYRGLWHDHFRNWRIDCDMKSLNNRFWTLNTTKADNALYYGQAFGQFEAQFRGTFSRTDIKVIAKTGDNSKLYIPLTDAADAQEVRFIKFKSKEPQPIKDKNVKSFKFEDLKGLNFEMDLTVTEAAEVQLIFDEQAGDIIKGWGEGDLSFIINREGEFKMSGNYRIRRGEYLFTLLNWINKPFTVASGGTINWYGDPYGAQINLDATYEKNASLYNLLIEELQVLEGSQSTLVQEARKGTRGIVTMHLKGDLMKPNISFDLAFPDASTQINSLVESKMRLLRQDPNELNRQVFGLIVVGSFLPANSASFIQSSDYLNTAINTVTQMLSNQLSNYFSGLIAEWSGSAVSSIDLDIAYNQYQNAVTPGQSGNSLGQELQVRLTSGFAKDRVTVRLGSQFGLGQTPGTATSTGFLGEDVVIEVQLTENKQWRLKVYQRTEPDFGGAGLRRARYGFGLSFRKDYDSFTDMMREAGAWFRRRS